MRESLRPPAGEMDTPVLILADNEAVDGAGYGETVIAAVPRIIRACWARVMPQSGREFYRASQVYATMTHLLTIDYVRELTVKMKVKLKREGRTLNIVGIIDPENRHVVQQVACQEAV